MHSRETAETGRARHAPCRPGDFRRSKTDLTAGRSVFPRILLFALEPRRLRSLWLTRCPALQPQFPVRTLTTLKCRHRAFPRHRCGIFPFLHGFLSDASIRRLLAGSCSLRILPGFVAQHLADAFQRRKAFARYALELRP